MPISVLFIQGAGENVHDQWDNKLVDSLRRELGDSYVVHYPRMPNEADPSYAAWKPAILKAVAALDNGAILVGHSVGGTLLLHTLANEHPNFRPGALILIAPPFIGNDGWPSGDIPPRIGFDLPSGLPILLYHGADDKEVPPDHANLYEKALPQAVVHRLPGRDHQLNNDLTGVANDIRAFSIKT
jgi:predicted alpha/beta hydrolase family esterase